MTDAPQSNPAFEIVNPGGKADILLIADHASLALPPEYGTLGLAPEVLRRHIGWDIGAADVTRRMAELLDAPAVLAGNSRLLFDCNRQPGNPMATPAISDGVTIPGNQDLDDEEIAKRQKLYFDPYHAAIEQQLNAFAERGVIPALISMHSFTPVMDGFERPWHAGLLTNKDERLVAGLLAALNAHHGVLADQNVPYSGDDPSGYTIHVHGEERGVPCVAVEIRQDLIDTHHGAQTWAGMMAGALGETLKAARPFSLQPVTEWRGAIGG
jgi:predicted N-formylglutamate amidohydrolase